MNPFFEVIPNEEILSFLQKIRLNSSYSTSQNDVGSIRRSDELEKQFMPANKMVNHIRIIL